MNNGHPISRRTPVWLRVVLNVNHDDPEGCWTWKRPLTPKGYGVVSVGKTITRQAHRVSYEVFVGPIPDGYTIDHLCHTLDASCTGGRACPHRACVNPAHLEAVTARENSLRGRGLHRLNAAKTHCQSGHEFTPENTYYSPRDGYRTCRACAREKQRVLKVRRKAAA